MGGVVVELGFSMLVVSFSDENREVKLFSRCCDFFQAYVEKVGNPRNYWGTYGVDCWCSYVVRQLGLCLRHDHNTRQELSLCTLSVFETANISLQTSGRNNGDPTHLETKRCAMQPTDP